MRSVIWVAHTHRSFENKRMRKTRSSVADYADHPPSVISPGVGRFGHAFVVGDVDHFVVVRSRTREFGGHRVPTHQRRDSNDLGHLALVFAETPGNVFCRVSDQRVEDGQLLRSHLGSGMVLSSMMMPMTIPTKTATTAIPNLV